MSNGDRCILTHERQGSCGTAPFTPLNMAHCLGNPPENPLLLFPLCLDCDLFHQQADRALFSRLADYITEANAVTLENHESQKIGYAAIQKMLQRISLGDPDARVVLPDDAGIFRDLESLLNKMADFIKQQVDDSHETAIGLCEHYETLLKLSQGDLDSKASTASSVELIAKLGELINGLVEAFKNLLSRQKKVEEERELLKDQLHHAQKLESIGQLAGGIAHEFNNILAAILGYAGIIAMRLESDSPNLKAVHSIINASEKAASLTRGMMVFGRKLTVSLSTVELDSFISAMREILIRLAGENIQLDFRLEASKLVVRADVGQLQQIVLNLYNNARDAMPDGGVLTIVTAGRVISGYEDDLPPGIPAGRYLQLTVSDSGHGISADRIARIFDPFFTTKEVGKGTGLGLSIVFGIVQQHNGFIKVNSNPGDGTSFSIWLPEFSAAVQAPDATQQETVKHGCETILVGEDNEDVRPMIIELLQGVGYQVLEACDGVEAVELMKDFGDTVDLLLLDVIMPRKSGYEALSNIREQYPEVPCLFLSGYSDDVLKQKAKISGHFEYLSKPITPDKLIKAVREALNTVRNRE